MDAKELNKIVLAVNPFDSATPGNLLMSIEHMLEELLKIEKETPDDYKSVVAVAITMRLSLDNWLELVEGFTLDALEDIDKLNVH